MPVSGAVVVPVPGREDEVERLLRSINGVEVMGRGSRGIAITLEGRTTRELYTISERVERLEDVVDFQLVYLNVEDEVEE